MVCHEIKELKHQPYFITNPFNPEHIGLKEITCILSSEQKMAINLLYFGGYTHTEASEAVTIPLGTLKSRARGAPQIRRKSIISLGVAA
jgi:RNA polymerase sigma-70 factor (ECF subfamily)